MSQRTQLLFLAAVLAVLGFLIVRQLGDGGAGNGPREKRERGSTRGGPTTADDVPALRHLHAPAAPAAEDDRDRDLFAYAESPADRDARRREQEEAERQRAALAEQRRLAEEVRRKAEAEAARRRAEKAARLASERALRDSQAAPVAPEGPRPDPPSFPYEYVGIIGPREDSFAILQTDDEKLLYAKAGDILDSSFLIHHVGKYTLHLGYTDPQFADAAAQVPRKLTTDVGGAPAAAMPRPSGRS